MKSKKLYVVKNLSKENRVLGVMNELMTPIKVGEEVFTHYPPKEREGVFSVEEVTDVPKKEVKKIKGES